MSDESYVRSRVRAELARVRDRAGLSTRQLAPLLGVTYGTVARDEHGPTLPPLPRVRRWLEACDVPAGERATIVELAERARSETRPWSELFAGGAQPQDELKRDWEDVSTLIRGWQPTVFPGVLQTPEYASAVLAVTWTSDVAGAVAARARRQAALYESATAREYLITESVWRAPWAPRPIAAAQRARALSLAELSTIQLSVVPDAVLVAPAWHNVTLYTVDGEVTARRELIDGTSDVVTDEGVRLHEIVWDRLRAAAVQPDALL